MTERPDADQATLSNRGTRAIALVAFPVIVSAEAHKTKFLNSPSTFLKH
jgi:hypothetical protein